MMAKLQDWLVKNRLHAFAVAVVIAVIGGVLTSEIYRMVKEDDTIEALGNLSLREAGKIHGLTLSDRASGAVAVSGHITPVIRAVAASAEPQSPTAQSPDITTALENLARSINGDGAFVVNSQGVITASWDSKERSRNGNNMKFRPYVQMALTGVESGFVAVGSSTNERALYIAAPVYNEAGDGVVGVVVARIGLGIIDSQLADIASIGMLLSPQGVVFASSRKDWLFHMAKEATPEQIRQIAALKQFGKTFDAGATPQLLPFNLADEVVTVAGHRYATAQAPLQWNGSSGTWSLLLLGELTTPWGPRLLIGGAVAVALLILLMGVWRGLKESTARHQAVAAAQQAAESLAAAAATKSRQAEFAASLQQARSLSAMSQTLFIQLSGYLPIHQGSLYTVADSDNEDERPRLQLAGVHGTENAPNEIEAGDGLVGQCAIEQQPICLTAPPQGFWRVASGLGEAAPRALLVLPILRNHKLLGVLELASLNGDFHKDLHVVEDLLPVVAANLEILLSAKRLEDTLTETNDWFNAVLDGAPDGILVIDGQGKIQLSNRAAEEIFGYGRTEMIGLPVDDLVPEHLGQSHAQLREQFSAPGDQPYRMAMGRDGLAGRRKDGQSISLSISLATLPLVEQQGRCICAAIRRMD